MHDIVWKPLCMNNNVEPVKYNRQVGNTNSVFIILEHFSTQVMPLHLPFWYLLLLAILSHKNGKYIIIVHAWLYRTVSSTCMYYVWTTMLTMYEPLYNGQVGNQINSVFIILDQTSVNIV